MEYFELLDEDGNRLGQVKERNQVHHDGDWHGGSHVWVMRKVEKEQDGFTPKGSDIQILLQKRRFDKDSFPGCYDVSCAGHMDAGETFLSTALRELEEELHITAKEEDLEFLFSQTVEGKYEFHGKPFWNREVNYVYLLKEDVPLDTLSYQESEIEDLKWMNIDELWEKVRQQATDFCIWKEELERLYEHLKNKEIRS